MEAILEVKNLSKKYENFTLNNISFSLPQGMIMGFIGENGSGKTTTIKAILNLIHKSSGEIEILGQSQDTHFDTVQKEIGVVLDDMFFPEILSAKEIDLIMKDTYETWDSTYFYKLLKEFSISPMQQIKTLSKGMRKKLEIITALAHHPKLLICDEPTNGLDPIARDEILRLFQEFIEDGTHSIFLSSHITSDLEHIADYITFIHQGQILLSKTRDEIMDKFAIAKCSENTWKQINQKDYLSYKKEKYFYEVLVEDKKAFQKKYNCEVLDTITLDELMLLMIKGDDLKC